MRELSADPEANLFSWRPPRGERIRSVTSVRDGYVIVTSEMVYWAVVRDRDVPLLEVRELAPIPSW